MSPRGGTLATATVGAVVLCGAAVAQAAGAPTYTLEQAVKVALEHNLELAETLAEVEVAEADLRRARAGRWPRLDYTQFFGPVPQARGDAVFSPDSTTDYLSGLGPFTRLDLRIVQPLYTFGKLEAAERAARAGGEARRANGVKKRAEIAFSVTELYHNVLLNRGLGRELGDVEKALAKALGQAEERLEKGAAGITQIDVLKLAFGLDGVRKDLVTIHKGERLSHAALARAMGLPPDAAFEIVDLEQDAVAFPLRPLAEYRAWAVSQRADLGQLAAATEAKQALVAKQRSDLYPTLFLMGIISYAVAPNRTDQKNPFVRDDFNFLIPGVVLGLRWELNAVQLAELARAKAESDQLAKTRASAGRGVALDVERCYAEVEASQQALELARTRRRTGRNMTAIAATNFELGVGEAREILESLERHSRGISELYLAVRDHNIAVARLQQAAGLLPE